MSSSFPEVCTAFLLFVIIPETTASECRVIIFKIKIDKNLFKKFYRTRKVTQLSYSIHRTFHGRNLNFDVVINTFVEQKTQKKGILIIKILTQNKIVISIQYAL